MARRPSRLTSGVYSAVAVILVIAVVAVAYGSAAPQLGVAEFAPTARSELEAPPTTAGDNERAGGLRGRRSTTTSAPSTTSPVDVATSGEAGAPTTRVARTRPCFGNPPRQLEDPMSPACLAAMFEGDNGGATARGVSLTEIRVGVLWISTPTGAEKATIDALFELFNQRFEFYGRRLVPVYFGGNAGDPVAARALVSTMVAQGIFIAMIGALEVVDPHPALAAEMARQGVVTIVRGAAMGWSDRTLYDALHPYVWSVYPSIEDVQSNVADFTCSALINKPARFSVDPAVRGTTRKFGVLGAANVTPPNISVLTDRLAACTGEAPVKATAGTSAEFRTGMERMKAAGVTTMFCICADQWAQNGISTGHALTYYPEWVINPVTWYGCENECWIKQGLGPIQFSRPIMLNAAPRVLPLQTRFFYGALQDVLATPGYSATSVLGLADLIYPQLMVLASGVQAAGPALTAETFAAGLMSAQFPNPGAGQPPYWQGGVGFGPGDHSFYDDYSIGWWSDDADALETAQGSTAKGSWCFVDQAARFRVGAYTADIEAKLFNTALPCR